MRVYKLLALGAAALALAWGLPSTTQATCPNILNISMCATFGMDIIGTTTNNHFVDPDHGVGGSFWRAGAGDPAIGPGSDSGFYGKPVVDPTTGAGGDWLSDFIIGDGSNPDRCFIWDWASQVDGCGGTGPGSTALPTDIINAVISDTNNNYAVLSVAGDTVIEWDNILGLGGDAQANGNMVPNAFGAPGILLQRGVSVASSSAAGGTATVTVNPLAWNEFDDLSGARYPNPGALNADLFGFVGGVWQALGTGPAGGTVNVDIDSRLCWGFTTGEFVPSDISTGGGHLGVACVEIGGTTPSQHVDKAVAVKSQGNIDFNWHVTAQFDILGFDIVSIDPTKGQERKLNSSPIFQGTNSGVEQSYSVKLPRSVIKRPGVFELRMTRQDGSVTATTFINE